MRRHVVLEQVLLGVLKRLLAVFLVMLWVFWPISWVFFGKKKGGQILKEESKSIMVTIGFSLWVFLALFFVVFSHPFSLGCLSVGINHYNQSKNYNTHYSLAQYATLVVLWLFSLIRKRNLIKSV